MKLSMVTGPGSAEVVDADKPTPGRKDVLVRMRACGICGSDAFYITIGGIPPRQNHTPLGHEPAGEVVEVGAGVTDIAVGERRDVRARHREIHRVSGIENERDGSFHRRLDLHQSETPGMVGEV